MKVLYLLLAWIFCIDFAFSTNNPMFRPFGNYEYYLGGWVRNYATAEKQCRKRNASLAILNSSAINDFLVYEMGEISDSYPYSFYIGLKKILPSKNDLNNSVFKWIDGSPLIYSNWNYDEPNGLHGSKYCVTVGWSNRLKVDSKWRDTICTTTSRYVCQRPRKGNIAEKSLQGIYQVRNNIVHGVDSVYPYPYEGGAPSGIYGEIDGLFDRGNEVRVYVNGTRTVFAVEEGTYSSSEYEFSRRADYPFMALLWIKNTNTRMVNYTLKVSGIAGRIGYFSIHEGTIVHGQFKAQYKAFQTNRADGRPSVCEIYLVISSSTVWQSSSDFTFLVSDDDQALSNSVTVVGRPRRSIVGYFLLSKFNSLTVRVAEIERVLRLILSTFAPDNFAEITLSGVNRVRSDVKASVEHWYNYQYDGVEPTEITNGGNDMYDGGNRVRVHENGIEVKLATYNKPYSTDMYDFSSRADHPFIALLWIKNPEEKSVEYTIQVTGKVGAGNGGLYSRFNGTVQYDEFTTRYYVFQLHGSNGPSICEIYFVISSYSVWHSSNNSVLTAHLENGSDQLSNSLSLQGKLKQLMLGYMLLSSATGDRLLPSQIEAVLQLLMYSRVPKNFAEKNLQSISSLNLNITSSIPNWYSYKYDGNDPREIYNGGGDMYNRGNRVRIFFNGWEFMVGIYNCTYSFPEYDFSTRAEYPFTALLWMINPKKESFRYTIEVSGNTILRHNRTLSPLEGKIKNDAFSAEYFVFQTHRTGGPTICEVYFVISSATVWQSSPNLTFSIDHFSTAANELLSNSVSVRGRPNQSMLGYTLLSRENGEPLRTSEIENSIRVIMARLVPGFPPPQTPKWRDNSFLPSCTVRQITTRVLRCENIFSSPTIYDGAKTCRSTVDKAIRCVLKSLAPCKRGPKSRSIDVFGLPYFNSQAMVTYLRGLRSRKGGAVNKDINTFCFHAPFNLTYPHKVETDLHMCDGSFLDDLLAQTIMFYYSYTWARDRADICSAFRKLRQWFVESTWSRCNIREALLHISEYMSSNVTYMERVVDIMLEVAEGFETSTCFSEIERTARRSR